MQPDWEKKTASDGQQETANPFAPIDYTSRLQRAVKPTGHSAAPQPTGRASCTAVCRTYGP